MLVPRETPLSDVHLENMLGLSRMGATILPPYGIKRFQGIPVAFIGLTLKDTPTIVVPDGVRGLTFRDEAETVNALVPELRKQGIEAIVVRGDPRLPARLVPATTALRWIDHLHHRVEQLLGGEYMDGAAAGVVS